VTVIASGAEGAGDAAHGGDQLIVGDVRREYAEVVELEIIGRRFLRFLLTDRRARGDENGGDEGQSAKSVRH